ncbi:tetratricopeptide repeat protein [Thiomicrorhabdus sp. Kp2]|uniref:tetratricopeptide repeat protein n=1 Tax=Thiomicrorhabdus sp. Kp2 TaxID=1123518 RepID=UPI00041AB07A|nr:tetratricopeptide repeat protein [Thiomicrorhabdus sp. Kp2]
MSSNQVLNFEISQSNFNSVVLMNSYKLPVFTLFMSPSLGMCIQLENLLTNFAEDFAGQFLLARVDIDMETDLREQYEIVNVPTLKVFKDGEMVHQEVGLLEEAELAALLKSYGIYKASDEMREQAKTSHLNGDTAGAIKLLTEAIQSDPSNTRVALDMIQILLDINELTEAKSLFNRLPDKDKNSEIGKAIIGQMTFKDLATKTPGLVSLLKTVEETPEDYEARLYLAVCYVAEHAYEEALDQVFEILENDRGFKEGAAQELTITIINMLEGSQPELAKDARRVLSNLLAQ